MNCWWIALKGNQKILQESYNLFLQREIKDVLPSDIEEKFIVERLVDMIGEYRLSNDAKLKIKNKWVRIRITDPLPNYPDYLELFS